jgi:hypothetical protein
MDWNFAQASWQQGGLTCGHLDVIAGIRVP